MGEFAERDALRRTLQTLRQQRETDEREAAQLDRLQAEIARTRRDRDAEMSAEIDQARREIERTCVDAEDLMVAASRLLVRVQIAGLGEGDPVLHAAQRVFYEDVRAAMEAFANAVNSEDEDVLS